MAGFGGGAHLGGLGGAGRIGGAVGGMHLGEPGESIHVGGDHLGMDHPYGAGIRYHAMHRYDRYLPGYSYGYADPNCYDWYELHPDQPLPLSCG